MTKPNCTKRLILIPQLPQICIFAFSVSDFTLYFDLLLWFALTLRSALSLTLHVAMTITLVNATGKRD